MTFLIDQFHTLVNAGKEPSVLINTINKERPLGLDYSDIFHSWRATQLVGFSNLDVLELGGALPPEFVFKYLKPRSWFALESSEYDDNQNILSLKNSDYKNYQNYNYNACGWSKFYQNWKSFKGSLYDRIYSVAAFEHIPDLASCLYAMHEMLTTGGILYSYFTPIWSAPNGSHGFHPIELEEMGPHSHLFFNYSSLYDFLIGQNCSNSYAIQASENLYRSQQINRYTFEEYLSIFNASPFSSKQINPINRASFSDIYCLEIVEKIKQMYPLMKTSSAGFEVILKK